MEYVEDLPGYEHGQKYILERLADLHHDAYTAGDGATTFTELVEELLHNNGIL